MFCVTLCEVTVTLADPGVVAAIRETETTPVALGVMIVIVWVVLLKVPRVVVNVTEVPFGTGVSTVSFRVAVMTLVLAPSAGMVTGDAPRVMEPTGIFATKVTVVASDKSPNVAVTVAVPIMVGAVNVTVAMPSSSVTPLSELRVPEVVVKLMGAPLTASPDCFLSRTVMVEVSVPLARMIWGSAFMSSREKPPVPAKVTVVEAE